MHGGAPEILKAQEKHGEDHRNATNPIETMTRSMQSDGTGLGEDAMNAGRWSQVLSLVVFLMAPQAWAQPAALPTRPDAAATIDQDKFPTAGRHDTLLHVLQPGRFSI